MNFIDCISRISFLYIGKYMIIVFFLFFNMRIFLFFFLLLSQSEVYCYFTILRALPFFILTMFIPFARVCTFLPSMV